MAGRNPFAFSRRNFGLARHKRQRERETRDRASSEGLARINEAPNISTDRAEFTTSRRLAGRLAATAEIAN